MFFFLSPDSSPEAPVATTLSEAIRAKESIEKLTTILESVTDVIPDLANDKDSECISVYIAAALIVPSLLLSLTFPYVSFLPSSLHAL